MVFYTQAGKIKIDRSTARSRTKLSPEFTYNSRNRVLSQLSAVDWVDTERFWELWGDSKKFQEL
jgi:hypothetical protein